MIDIHMHLLANVDDGAQSNDDSLSMCRLAEESGCTHVFATPHQFSAWPTLTRREIEQRAAALNASYSGNLEVLSGGEVHVTDQSVDDLLAQGSTATGLGGTRYTLLEFGANHTAHNAGEIIHELMVAGLSPIIAHPEFIPFLVETPELIDGWSGQGIQFQVTAMSVTGEFGSPAQKFAHSLIDRGTVHYVASDAHSPTWRPPGLEAAREVIERTWGREIATSLTRSNAQRIVEEARRA